MVFIGEHITWSRSVRRCTTCHTLIGHDEDSYVYQQEARRCHRCARCHAQHIAKRELALQPPAR